MENIFHYFWNVSPTLARQFLIRSSDKLFSPAPSVPLTTSIRLRHLWTVLNGLYLLVFGVGRFLLGLYLVAFKHDLTTWFKYDGSTYVIMEVLKLSNLASIAAFIPFPFFCFAIDYTTYIKRYNYIFRLNSEYIFTNKEDFFQFNPQLQWSFNWRQPMQSVKQGWQIMAFLRHPPKQLVDGVRFKVNTFKYAPHMVKRTRIQLVLRSLQMQALVAFCHFLLILGSAIIAPIAYLVFYLPNAQTYIAAVVSLIDVIFIVYNFISLCTLLLHGGHHIICKTFFVAKHTRLVNEMLSRMIRQVAAGRVSMTILALNLRTYYFKEHSNLFLEVIHNNRNIISPIILACFASNLSTNMYMLSVLLFQYHLSPPVVVGLVLLLAIQFIATLALIGPLIRQIEDLYSCQGELFQAQAVLQSQNKLGLLATKLKLLHYLGLVCTNEKIGYTVGPMGRITRFAFAEFLIFYTANLLAMLTYLRKL